MIRPKTISNGDALDLIHWIDGVHKLIISVAIQTGLRISDILSLKRRDVKSRQMRVWESKSKRHRDVEITETLHSKLMQLV